MRTRPERAGTIYFMRCIPPGAVEGRADPLACDHLNTVLRRCSAFSGKHPERYRDSERRLRQARQRCRLVSRQAQPFRDAEYLDDRREAESWLRHIADGEVTLGYSVRWLSNENAETVASPCLNLR